jgi:hypothetical protein
MQCTDGHAPCRKLGLCIFQSILKIHKDKGPLRTHCVYRPTQRVDAMLWR